MDQDLMRLAVAAAIVLAALATSVVIRRRRASDPPTQVTRNVPSQLDRADFPEVDSPWLVAVFTSATCSTCADVVAKSRVLQSDDVAVLDIWRIDLDTGESETRSIEVVLGRLDPIMSSLAAQRLRDLGLVELATSTRDRAGA